MQIKDVKDLLLLFLVGLIIVQGSSLALSKIIGIPVFKLGQAILLILLASALTIVINVSYKFENLRKEDIAYFFILVGFLVACYFYLPKFYPEIFSIFKSGVFSVVQP